MNTPAHLLLGAALFSKQGAKRQTSASLLGAALPDVSLYLLAGVSLFVLGLSPQRVFDELYFSDAWQRIFAIDNSAIVWGIFLAATIWRGWAVGIALSASALLHIATDMALHHDDGRPHFWPLTMWVFESPVSYWDSRHHAGLVAPVTLLISTISAIVLWRRFPVWAGRAGILLLLSAEIWVARQWLLFF